MTSPLLLPPLLSLALALNPAQVHCQPTPSALERARCGGKYRDHRLLGCYAMPKDPTVQGRELLDFGPWGGASWAGWDYLPAGNWVWVRPCWYIWSIDPEPP